MAEKIRVCDYTESTEHALLVRLKYPADGLIEALDKKCEEASRPGYKCGWFALHSHTIIITGTLNQIAALKHWVISSNETVREYDT